MENGLEESESKHRENNREVLRVKKGGRGVLAVNWARGSLHAHYGVSRENRSECTYSRHI